MKTEPINRLRPPKQLVENKVSFSGPSSEVSIYDTYEPAKRVKFEAQGLLFCGMLTGRKTMYMSHNHKGEVFLPHESFVMAPGEKIEIDFPDATNKAPTTCLTIGISAEKVNEISKNLSHDAIEPELITDWQIGQPILHTHHSSETQRLLNRLTKLFTENHPDRNALIDLNISELIIRLLRDKTRDFLLTYSSSDPEANSLLAALDWINSTLSKSLDIEQLCKHAGMSRSRLYNEFKENLACSPLELQQQLRLKRAAERLQSGESITAISYDLGFNSPSHFCYRFKNQFGCTATEYRKRSLLTEVKG